MSKSGKTQPVVGTTSGQVAGEICGDVLRFRGLPFSAPTDRAGRFRRACRAPTWHGVHVCDHWAALAPQVPDAVHHDRPFYTDYLFGRTYPVTTSEDRLELNLWTPALDGGARPVLVWLHGGGFITGVATRPREDGARLAQRGDVVVVAPTHRLGIFGYALFDGTDRSGNLGLWDIVLALEWVRDNIASFGGDPDNVTIIGESGGGMKVSALLAMRAAKGLFHRAACFGGILYQGHPAAALTEDEARLLTERVTGALEKSVAELRDLPVEDIVDAQRRTAQRPLTWRPVIDGETLTEHPDHLIAAGAAVDIPLMIGTAAHEADFLSQISPAFRSQSYADLEPLLEADLMRRLVPAYESMSGNDEMAGARRLLTDLYFVMPSLRFAEAQARAGGKVYVYQFDWTQPRAPGLRSTHGTETTFLFGNLETTGMVRGFEEARSLSDRWQTAFLAFMRDGLPKAPDLPDWPAYDLSERSVLVLDRDPKVLGDPNGALREIWTA